MLTQKDLTNLKDLIGDVVAEKIKLEIGENFKEKIDRIEINTDAACKVGSDNRQELAITESKVDDHEVRISDLESNFATL